MAPKSYWITGYPGAGKSTLARELRKHLQAQGIPHVLLDGDELRAVLNPEAGYAPEDRKKLAFAYGRLCQMLARQDLTVVIATVSMFDDCRAWNRQHIPNYREIYLKASAELLRQRDQKGLYSDASSGRRQNVPTINQQLEEPKNPDLVLDASLPVHMLREAVLAI